jgi:hypothetical protein
VKRRYHLDMKRRMEIMRERKFKYMFLSLCETISVFSYQSVFIILIFVDYYFDVCLG